MAGRGFAPNPSRQPSRAGNKKEFRVVEFEPGVRPELPSFSIETDGELVDFVWPQTTVDWWDMWAGHPLAEEFSDSDWSFLLDTALLHAAVWRGELKLMPELRLRVAKFGVTPEDRARLRVQFAAADEADEKRGTRQSSKSRRPGLRLAE